MKYIKYFLSFFHIEDCLLNVDKKKKNTFYLKENFHDKKKLTINLKLLLKTIRWQTISSILIFVLILLNLFLPTTMADLVVLFILSTGVLFLYVYQTSIWKFKSFICYILGIIFWILYEVCFLSPYLIVTTIFLFLYSIYIYQTKKTKERDYCVNMIVLNTFLISIFFVVLKYFLLKNCVDLTKYLNFVLTHQNSKIALNVNFVGIYTPYPEGQYKVLLNLKGYNELAGFLTSDWDNSSIKLIGTLFLFSISLDKLLPFLEITLIIYN
jgi:hypothetical protein